MISIAELTDRALQEFVANWKPTTARLDERRQLHVDVMANPGGFAGDIDCVAARFLVPAMIELGRAVPSDVVFEDLWLPECLDCSISSNGLVSLRGTLTRNRPMFDPETGGAIIVDVVRFDVLIVPA